MTFYSWTNALYIANLMAAHSQVRYVVTKEGIKWRVSRGLSILSTI